MLTLLERMRFELRNTFAIRLKKTNWENSYQSLKLVHLKPKVTKVEGRNKIKIKIK